jgi:hypothetical protein
MAISGQHTDLWPIAGALCKLLDSVVTVVFSIDDVVDSFQLCRASKRIVAEVFLQSRKQKTFP